MTYEYRIYISDKLNDWLIKMADLNTSGDIDTMINSILEDEMRENKEDLEYIHTPDILGPDMDLSKAITTGFEDDTELTQSAKAGKKLRNLLLDKDEETFKKLGLTNDT